MKSTAKVCIHWFLSRSFWRNTAYVPRPERHLAKLLLRGFYPIVPTWDLRNITVNFFPEALHQFFLRPCLKLYKRGCVSGRVRDTARCLTISRLPAFFVAASA